MRVDEAGHAHTARLTLNSDGEVAKVRPASFLELWNTVFAAVGLIWIFLVAACLIVYYLKHLPPAPVTTGMSAGQAKETLDIYKQVYDSYKQSVSDVFDLLVTRTILPIVTLLLGYLFGKTSGKQS